MLADGRRRSTDYSTEPYLSNCGCQIPSTDARKNPLRRLAIADCAKADAENQHDHVDHNAEQAKSDCDETEHLGFLRRVLGAGDIARCYFAIYLCRENNGRDRERPATEYRDYRRH